MAATEQPEAMKGQWLPSTLSEPDGRPALKCSKQSRGKNKDQIKNPRNKTTKQRTRQRQEETGCLPPRQPTTEPKQTRAKEQKHKTNRATNNKRHKQPKQKAATKKPETKRQRGKDKSSQAARTDRSKGKTRSRKGHRLPATHICTPALSTIKAGRHGP